MIETYDMIYVRKDDLQDKGHKTNVKDKKRIAEPERCCFFGHQTICQEGRQDTMAQDASAVILARSCSQRTDFVQPMVPDM